MAAAVDQNEAQQSCIQEGMCSLLHSKHLFRCLLLQFAQEFANNLANPVQVTLEVTSTLGNSVVSR